MQLEEVEAAASEDERAAQQASTEAVRCSSAGGRRVARFRIICRESASSSPHRRPAPAADRPGCRSSARDVTETLEVIPRRWKVIQTVRERFRDCETIAQPPAPFHVTARGFARTEPARHHSV